jgi:transposase
MARKPYPSDVKEDEWEFVAPSLALIREDSPQREHDLRESYNDLGGVVRAGAPWRMIPDDLPPWGVVYQLFQRRIRAGVFEEVVHDCWEVLRIAAGREANPTAVVIDSRTLQRTPESGNRGAHDGAKRKKGSKVHVAVDTLGHLLALHVTPAEKKDRSQVRRTAKTVQKATSQRTGIAYIDQGYTGEQAKDGAEDHGIMLHVVKLSEAKRGFVLLPRRCVVERGFAWMTRLRRLAKTVAGLHSAVFAYIMLARCLTMSA